MREIDERIQTMLSMLETYEENTDKDALDYLHAKEVQKKQDLSMSIKEEKLTTKQLESSVTKTQRDHLTEALTSEKIAQLQAVYS